MKLNIDIDKLAALAALEIDPAEKEALHSALCADICFAQSLNEIDTAGTEQTSVPFQAVNSLREDTVFLPQGFKEKLLDGAGAQQDGFIAIPHIRGEENA